MMFSIKDGDLEVVDGMLVMVEGAEMMRQHLEIRLKIWRGEVFYAMDEGVDYRDLVFPFDDPAVVGGEFRRVAMGTPGIQAVNLQITTDQTYLYVAGRFIGSLAAQNDLVRSEFKVQVQKG